MAKEKKTFLPLLWVFFLLWSLFGVFTLWLHNDVLPWVFFFWLIGIFGRNYMTSRSFYMDKDLLFGLVWTGDKKSRSLKWSWLCYVSCPVVLSLYTLDWKIPLVYMIMALIWHGVLMTSDE